ncbi:MAG: SagB family peptide dehydrogenase, partial [Chloroflexota bacterium]
MDNNDITVACDFHDMTKYTAVEQDGELVGMMGTPPDLKPSLGEQSPHNEPHPFKVYSTLDRIALPREFEPLRMPLLEAIALPGGNPDGEGMPDRASLARIALLSNGILKRGRHGTGRVIEYRAAGGTGARYHLELYFVCGDLDDLDAGVYHYAADTHEFRPVRSGDYRAALVEATGEEPAVAEAPAMLVATSTFWRNAWRYQERAYRHTWWDLGTTLTNVLAVAAGEDLNAKVVMGFDDGSVNRLLGVDGEREAAVCIVPLGIGNWPGPAPEVTALNHAVEPVSPRDEYDFPKIWEMHAASSLKSGAEVAEWRSGRIVKPESPAAGATEVPLQPLEGDQLPDMPVDEAIRRRRSTRHYDPDVAIPFDAVSTMLDRAMQPVAFDCLDPDAGPLIDPYLIVNNVEGLDPGSYALHG